MTTIIEAIPFIGPRLRTRRRIRERLAAIAALRTERPRHLAPALTGRPVSVVE